MNSNIIVVEITRDVENIYYRYAKNIARHLRQVDKDEISALLNCVPENDIMECYHTSDSKWIVLDVEGTINVPVILFGITPHQEDASIGIPWMVATNGIKRIGKFLMANYGKYLNIMKQDYDMLVNFVDERNTDSIKWLKRIGFTLEDAAPFGHHGLPFHRFWMECG